MSTPAASTRLDYLDATRAFALVLGIIFHASLSFLPFFMGWAVQDVSTGPGPAIFMVVSHSFRMALFFVLAGFFGRMTFHRLGAARFLGSRAVRLVVPFVVGWFLLRPLIVAGWSMGFASLRGDYEFFGEIERAFLTYLSLPDPWFTGSHLWFLYYLAIITAIVVTLRTGLRSIKPAYAVATRASDAGIAWLARSAWGILALALPTALALWFMAGWSVDTPDRTLEPHVPVMLIYGGAFVLGWAFGRAPECLAGFARLSVGRVVVAVAAITATLLLVPIQMDPGHPHFAAVRAAHCVSYAVMAWSLIALTTGLFQRYCSQPRPLVRYVADSSYWMYLVHLPVVVWLQVAVAEVETHWSLKLGFISAVTIAVSLVTYDLFVRSTFLGQVLNGRRRPRAIFARRKRVTAEARA